MNDKDKYKLLDGKDFKFPLIKSKINEDGDYEFELPIEMFDGYQVHEKESGEFLGWVDAKNHRIVKYVVNETIHEDDKECSK